MELDKTMEIRFSNLFLQLFNFSNVVRLMHYKQQHIFKRLVVETEHANVSKSLFN